MSDTTYTNTHTRSICKDGASRVLYKKKFGRGQNGSVTLCVKVRKPDGTFGYSKFVPQEGNKKQKGGRWPVAGEGWPFKDGKLPDDILQDLRNSDELKQDKWETDVDHLLRLKHTLRYIVVFDNYYAPVNGKYEGYKGRKGITGLQILPNAIPNAY